MSTTTILSEMADIDAQTARIFASTYGISLTDAMRASYYARRRGSEKCARALLLVEMSGCSFLTAAQAIEDADARPTFTAPLNGRTPAMRGVR